MIKKIAATLLFTAALLASDPPREQKLQQAIDLMESKGDLAHATPLLEEVARSSDRALAARGLLYLGQAQERKGADRARATYERIIKDFNTQTEAVAEARKRLAGLSPANTTTAMTVHQVFTDASTEWSLTPDGRSIMLQDSSGDIAIRDIASGRVRRFMAKSGKDSRGSGWSPVVSPDQRQVAYAWNAGYSIDDPATYLQYSLRVLSLEVGGKPRVLVSNLEYQWLDPSAWSTDGKSILTTFWKADNTQLLAWVSVADGSVKVLKSLEWRQADKRKSLSPDGGYITYSALVRPDSTDRHIYVLASDGSSETEVVSTTGVNEVPLWTPDGGHIIFSSNRSGSSSLWSIPIKDGKAAGPASLVKADTGNIFPLGFTRSGSYYYRHEQGGEDVFVADLDRRDGKVHGAVRLSENFVGSNYRPAWSPDGRFVAFKRRIAAKTPSPTYELVVHALETGQERTYPNTQPSSSNGRPVWFHDGKSILLNFIDKQNRISFHRVDLTTGQWKEVIPPDSPDSRIGVSLFWYSLAVLSPDDKTLYVHAGTVEAYDLTTGQHKTLFPIPDNVWNLAVSPDGRMLAVVTPGGSGGGKARLFVIGTEYHKELTDALIARNSSLPKWPSKEAAALQALDPLPKDLGPYPGFRELYVRQWGISSDGGMLAWAPDGQTILFGLQDYTSPSTSPRVELMRIRAEGGTPESTGLVTNGLRHSVDVSPDGSRITFSSGVTKVSDVWTVDNLLPLLKASK